MEFKRKNIATSSILKSLDLITYTFLQNYVEAFLEIPGIMITFSCEEVYPQCAALTRGNNPLTKLIK